MKRRNEEKLEMQPTKKIKNQKRIDILKELVKNPKLLLELNYETDIYREEITSLNFEITEYELKDQIQDFLFKAIEVNNECIKYVDLKYFDKTFASLVLTKFPELLIHFPEEFKLNEKFLLEELSNGLTFYLFIDENIKNRKFFFENVINLTQGSIIRYLSQEQKDNEYIVLRCFKEYQKNSNSYSGNPIKYASERIKNNKTFILCVFDAFTYDSLPITLKLDLDILKLLLEKRYTTIFSVEDCSENLENLKEIQDYFPNEIYDDRERVLHLINFNPFIYYFLPLNLKRDPKIAIKTLEKNHNTIGIIDFNLFKDYEFFKTILQIHGEYFYYVRSEHQENIDLIRLSLENQSKKGLKLFSDYNLYDSLPKKLQLDRNIILLSLKKNLCKGVFKYAFFFEDKDLLINSISYIDGLSHFINKIPIHFMEDKEFVLDLIKANPKALRYIDSKYSNDKSLVIEVIRRKVPLKCFKLFYQDREVIIEAIKSLGTTLKNLSGNFENDLEIQKISIESSSQNLPKDCENKELIALAYRKKGFYIDHFHNNVLKDRDFMIELIKINPMTFGSQLLSFYKKDKDFLKFSFEKNPKILLKNYERFINDLDFCSILLQNDSSFFYHFPMEIQFTKEIYFYFHKIHHFEKIKFKDVDFHF